MSLNWKQNKNNPPPFVSTAEIPFNKNNFVINLLINLITKIRKGKNEIGK